MLCQAEVQKEAAASEAKTDPGLRERLELERINASKPNITLKLKVILSICYNKYFICYFQMGTLTAIEKMMQIQTRWGLFSVAVSSGKW